MAAEALIAAYRATQYRVSDGARPLILRIDEAVPAEIAGAIVTAFNPGSVLQTTEANHAAAARLDARIAAAGFASWPCVAEGDDAAWVEEGRLIRGIDLDDALHLAEDFGQLAIVWIEAGMARLVMTRLWLPERR